MELETRRAIWKTKWLKPKPELAQTLLLQVQSGSASADAAEKDGVRPASGFRVASLLFRSGVVQLAMRLLTADAVIELDFRRVLRPVLLSGLLGYVGFCDA